MKLTELFKGIDVEWQGEAEINSLQFDSRQVKLGDVFVATVGVHVDGHDYIAQAVERGASVVVVEREVSVPEGVIVVKVKNAASVLPQMAANFYGCPSEKLKVVGVTGTNGKTTIATVLYKLFINLGYKVGLISTIKYYVGEEEYPSTHTTPDALQIQKLMRQMVDAGCSHCFMEVSSHAIHQDRVKAIDFDGGIFTNITHDHLDYHKTFAEYIKAKKKFFDELKPKAFALTNEDDKNGMVMLQNTSAQPKTYALKSVADYKCKVLEKHIDGMLLEIDGVEVWTHFAGIFNAYNLMAIYASAILLGEEKDEVLAALSAMTPVAGRFEIVRSADGKFAIVDYAHTPDALKNVLNGIQEIKRPEQRIITVVGCGGDRDKTKRPIMAQEAMAQSDKVILTSDNPRTEVPATIIAEMEAGLLAEDRAHALSIENRKEAIRTACMLAQSGDIILIAGKGHEDYQEINGVKHHFDDKEVVMEVFGK